MLRARVHEFERLLEDALAEGGALVGDLVRARRDVGLSTVVGQPVFDAVLEALEAVGGARGKAIQAHRQLDRMGQALGLDETGYGDAGKDPLTGPLTTAAREARPAA